MNLDPTGRSKDISSQYSFDSLPKTSPQRDLTQIISKIGAEQIQNLSFVGDTIDSDSLQDFNISNPSGAASEQADKVSNLFTPPEELAP
jgi:hypothetical protein